MPEPILDIVIYGKAEPAGSKDAQVVYKKGPGGRPVPVIKDGRVVVNVRDDNPKSKGWKDQVAQTVGAARAGEALVDGPVAVWFTFYRPRNIGDFGTGRNAGTVRNSAPAYPIVRPDVLKLARGVEDALTGVVWRDDAQIVDETLRKRYGEPARVEVRVVAMAAQTAADLPLAERARPPELAPAGAQQQLIAA
jgi:Holliday junction resolvase RusA-like endonuclease